MSTPNEKLALRQQSIRTLTADELSMANGGTPPIYWPPPPSTPRRGRA